MTQSSKGQRARWALLIASLLLIWAPFLWPLSYSWDMDSYYSYGWLVPLLVAVLVWIRLEGGKILLEESSLDKSWLRKGVYALLATCLCTYALAIVAMGANPFWRFPLWLCGVSLVGISLGSIYLVGGGRLAAVLAFPLGFALTMVPWPFAIENGMITGMTRLVTLGVVEMLRLASYPAVQYGNVIQVGETTVGVEEACSGIKSIQALFMLTLFVGVFWKLTLKSRLVLVGLGLLFAGGFNLLRSFTLSLLAIEGGQEVFDEWHDMVGHVALFASIIAVFLISSRFPALKAKELKAETARGLRPRSPILLGSALLIFTALPLSFSAVWYSENPQAGLATWDLDLGRASGESFNYEAQEIQDHISEILGFDYGLNFSIKTPAGELVGESWYYGFTGEDIRKSLGAYSHTPDICMTGSGARLVERRGRVKVDMGLFAIPFQHFVFEFPNGAISQVFWCMWDDVFDGDGGQALEDESRRSIKINSIIQGQNSHKRKVLLVGLRSEESAASEVQLRRLVRDIVAVQEDGEIVSFK